MSSRKQSVPGGLQRSRSSSQIRIPNRQSRMPVRNSMQQNRGMRLSRPTTEKRSLDRNFGRCSTNNSFLEVPRTTSQRSSSLNRPSVMTPLNQNLPGSSRKSPLLSSVRKDYRPITDKKWQYEQVVKVRQFVHKEFPHLDCNNIKSGISLELFVQLMNSFFQLIDRRINITRDNYIDEVPSHLKRIRYPASIKPSLMKTVNTPHCWPQVIAIFSWLADIVTEINAPVEVTNPLVDIVDNCMMQLYHHWNVGQDDSETVDAVLEEMDGKLVRVLNINDSEMKVMNEEIGLLKQKKTEYEQRHQENEKKIKELQKKIEENNYKCDLFEVQNQEYEKKVIDKQLIYTQKIKKMDEELADLAKTEERVKATIAKQPHTRKDKEELKDKIELLQNTISLKEERCQKLRDLIGGYDFQLTDLKQKVETQAYRHNNLINKLELRNPELNDLYMRESGFARLDTEDELDKISQFLNLAIVKSKENLKLVQKKQSVLLEKDKKIDEELIIEETQLQKLIKTHAETSILHENNRKKVAEKIDKAIADLNKRRNKLEELKSSRFDLEPLQKKVEKLQIVNTDLLEFKEDFKTRALEFFIKLEGQVSSNLENYMQIMNNLSGGFEQTQEVLLKDIKERAEYLEHVQARYEEELKKL